MTWNLVVSLPLGSFDDEQRHKTWQISILENAHGPSFLLSPPIRCSVWLRSNLRLFGKSSLPVETDIQQTKNHDLGLSMSHLVTWTSTLACWYVPLMSKLSREINEIVSSLLIPQIRRSNSLKNTIKSSRKKPKFWCTSYAQGPKNQGLAVCWVSKSPASSLDPGTVGIFSITQENLKIAQRGKIVAIALLHRNISPMIDRV
jgi:hypothetical protein